MRLLTGKTTTDKLPLGDAKFKISLARPQQTTPFAALRACHPANKSRKSMLCGFWTGEATTDKLPTGDPKFKMSLARPQQTTPFAALRACHPAGVSPSGCATLPLKSTPFGTGPGACVMCIGQERIQATMRRQKAVSGFDSTALITKCCSAS